MADQLGPDDYKQLYEMSTSSDAKTRTQAASLSKKLTPAEQQSFFDYQKQAHPQGEIGREDNSVLGVPPELAVLAPVGIARAVSGASGATGGIVAGTKAALSKAAPIVKYEATRSALRAMHVPDAPASIIAAAVAGYGGKGSIAAAAPTAAEKIALSSSDVLKVQRLIAQGIPQQTAVDTVLRLTRGAAGSLASVK